MADRFQSRRELRTLRQTVSGSLTRVSPGWDPERPGRRRRHSPGLAEEGTEARG